VRSPRTDARVRVWAPFVLVALGLAAAQLLLTVGERDATVDEEPGDDRPVYAPKALTALTRQRRENQERYPYPGGRG